VLGNPIIAGDGYFYIPYQYKDATSITQSTLVCSVTGPSESTTVTADTAVHLTLMRVGTDGSSSRIDVKDWESRNLRMNSGGQAFPNLSSSVTSGAIPSLPWGQLLTNADQGTVLSWEADMPTYCGPDPIISIPAIHRYQQLPHTVLRQRWILVSRIREALLRPSSLCCKRRTARFTVRTTLTTR
jgi:hypothetical protein